MRAIVVREFGGPGVLQMAEIAEPPVGPGQVLVALCAAGVNPVDTYIREGRHAVRPALPYVPGEDGAGVVAKTGRRVRRLKEGDRVYVAGSLSGTYAEAALCAAAQVRSLPAPLTFAQGAAVGVPFLSAQRALFHLARARAGERVLVHGASGSVGLAAVQLALAAGCAVIGTAGSPAGRALVREQGVEHVLDHHAGDEEAAVRELTDGRGVDVILEMQAHRNLARDLALLLAPGGRVVLVGSRAAIEIDPRAAMVREAAVLGLFYYRATPAERELAHRALARGFASGSLRPVVRCELPLQAAERAHEEIVRPGARGKIVLVP